LILLRVQVRVVGAGDQEAEVTGVAHTVGGEADSRFARVELVAVAVHRTVVDRIGPAVAVPIRIAQVAQPSPSWSSWSGL
jgi:hypothetical protein